uniref:Uncharacterized protein n=1 Tax=Anguilla anguilla TaxID=7936 RepID=A0A0E9RZX9_ANGAN
MNRLSGLQRYVVVVFTFRRQFSELWETSQTLLHGSMLWTMSTMPW